MIILTTFTFTHLSTAWLTLLLGTGVSDCHAYLRKSARRHSRPWGLWEFRQSSRGCGWTLLDSVMDMGRMIPYHALWSSRKIRGFLQSRNCQPLSSLTAFDFLRKISFWGQFVDHGPFLHTSANNQQSYHLTSKCTPISLSRALRMGLPIRVKLILVRCALLVLKKNLTHTWNRSCEFIQRCIEIWAASDQFVHHHCIIWFFWLYNFGWLLPAACRFYIPNPSLQ